MLASRPTVMTLETITSAAFMTACSCHIDTIVENSAGVGQNSFVLLDVEHIVDAGKGGRSETSGLNSCSPVHTTTNVSRRRRRAFGFPLGSGLGLRGKREDSCVLPFIGWACSHTVQTVVAHIQELLSSKPP